MSVGDAEAHRVLLGAAVVVVEGLDLSAVEPGSYELCLPLKLVGSDGAPARARSWSSADAGCVRRDLDRRHRHARAGHGADDPELLGGRRAGVRTAVGVAVGQAVWALATSIGLAALIVAFEPAFVALKLAGAAFLIYLGAHALKRAIRGSAPETRAGGRIPRFARG